MNEPLISCIVPVYNGERYLGEAIQSILAQSYANIELIVADDGSTDRSCAIAREFGKSVTIVTQATAGPAATRNLGLDHATGQWISFLDADDLWHRDKLRLQMNRFQHRQELDFCITHIEMFWDEALRHEASHYREQPRTGAIPGYATTTLLARRNVFERIGTFDATLWFSDATDWFIRGCEAGLIREVIPEVLVYHRMHAGNLTRRRADASRDEFLNIVKASLDRRRARMQHGDA